MMHYDTAWENQVLKIFWGQQYKKKQQKMVDMEHKGWYVLNFS